MRRLSILIPLLLAGCQHIPQGSTISAGLQFQIGGKSPTAKQVRAHNEQYPPVLINGTPVDKAKYPHVVNIFMSGSACTASVVGPNAILTAAHCAETGQTVTFTTVDGKKFSAKATRAPGYPNKDLDIALAKTSTTISVKPISVRTDRFERKGDEVDLWGYGCTKPGGTGGNDGILRTGKSKVVGGQDYDLVLETPGGAALCYGDSGGPVTKDGKQIGVNSKGNIEDRSYTTRTTLEEAAAFLKDWSVKNSAPICGVTMDCDGGTPPPPPPGDKSFKFSNGVVSLEGVCE